jgi:hypothetical protein
MGDDQQRRRDIRREPSFLFYRWPYRVPEAGDVCRGVEYQKAPALGETGRRRSQSVVHDPVDDQSGPVSIVWLLDGAKDAETDRLAELLTWTSAASHVVLVSTCTATATSTASCAPSRRRFSS